MTKRIIRQKPTNGIERAARRAGIKPTPDARARKFIDDIGRTGQTLSRPGIEALAAVIRENGDEDLAKAFEGEAARVNGKAETTTDPYEAAMKHVTSRVGWGLVKACSWLAEEIAAIADSEGGDDYNVKQALRELWKLRWELGFNESEVTVEVKAPDHVIRRETARARKVASSNGAAAPEVSS